MQTISSINPARTWRFDAELLRRYDRPGPRYTSYPTAPHFAEGFGEADFRDLARRSNQDPIPRQLSLYVHIPYCQSPCFYCGCNRIITRDVARGRIYLDRLQREIGRRHVRTIRRYVGGALDDDELRTLGRLANKLRTSQRDL